MLASLRKSAWQAASRLASRVSSPPLGGSEVGRSSPWPSFRFSLFSWVAVGLGFLFIATAAPLLVLAFRGLSHPAAATIVRLEGAACRKSSNALTSALKLSSGQPAAPPLSSVTEKSAITLEDANTDPSNQTRERSTLKLPGVGAEDRRMAMVDITSSSEWLTAPGGENSGCEEEAVPEKRYPSLLEGMQEEGEEEEEVTRQSPPLPPEIESHVAFPGARQCGHWATAYKRLHDRVRSRQVAPRYLTWTPPLGGPGLGDRLVGVVSTFLAALLTGRAFIIADPDLAHAFAPAVVDWRVRPDVPLEVTTESFAGVKAGSVLRLDVPNGYIGAFPVCPSCEGPVTDLLEGLSGAAAASNIVIHSHRGLLVRIFHAPNSSRTHRALHALGLRLPHAFGCIARFLLRPRREVLRRAQRPLQSLLRMQRSADCGGADSAGSAAGGGSASSSICIHVRTRDGFAWQAMETEANKELFGAGAPEGELNLVLRDIGGRFLDCAKKAEDFWVPEGQKAVWYMMSDSAAVKEALREQYGDKVLLSPVPPAHYTAGQREWVVGAAADWLVFSACQFYILVDSGFSKTSFAYNMRSPRLLALFTRYDQMPYRRGILGSCDPAKPLDITALEDWSGL